MESPKNHPTGVKEAAEKGAWRAFQFRKVQQGLEPDHRPVKSDSSDPVESIAVPFAGSFPSMAHNFQ
jgi:hypothetical protein